MGTPGNMLRVDDTVKEMLEEEKEYLEKELGLGNLSFNDVLKLRLNGRKENESGEAEIGRSLFGGL